MIDMLQTLKNSNSSAYDKIIESQETLIKSPVDIFGLCKKNRHPRHQTDGHRRKHGGIYHS